MSLRRTGARGSLLALLVALAALAAWALAGAGTGSAVGGPSVQPVFIAGNPTCEDLGYDYGYKPQPEPPPSGTYTFPGDDATVTITSDGTYFDWTSTLGIDAVIVKGGPNANAYVYDPPAESFGDAGLSAPINPNNNTPYAISHIEFCYDYEVDVSKTANTTFKRTYDWTIDKSVTPDEIHQFTGDSTTATYTVSVTKTGYTDSDWAVDGTITIENDTPYGATIESVSDVVSPAVGVTPTCGVTFPYALASGATLECTYSTSLPDGTSRTNTATVTTSGSVGGGTATAAVTFGAPTTVVNDTVNVDDTNGSSWEFTGTGAVEYTKTFTCDADKGKHDNTATIRETKQSDSASVTVNCYALEVTKDAATSLTRTWNWTIDKSADQTSLVLSVGQQFLVNYSVEVDATSTDSAWAVNGGITVSNPAPIAATITGVSDVVSPAVAATVDCGVTFPYSLAAGGKLECTYGTALPDASGRTNTATATLQNSPSGTTDFSGTAAVSFTGATVTEVDECIDVTDSLQGTLGTVCASDTLPKTFTYSRWIGPYEVCGAYTVGNTASFLTNDTGTPGSDGWTVAVSVPCPGDGGCTLTPGYWKTHSTYGPAPYDDTWAQLVNGADTPFFLSGQSYYQVLWTAPQGNAYYILAHAYIAAQLNFLNGADPAAAQAAFDQATTLFLTYTPAQVAALKPSSPVRKQFIALATILDDYNNGYIGPGHCSE